MARRRRPEQRLDAATGTLTASHGAPVPPVELVECWGEDWLRATDYGRTSGASSASAAEPQAWAWSGLVSSVLSRQSQARADWASAHGLGRTEMARRYRRRWRAPRWRTER